MPKDLGSVVYQFDWDKSVGPRFKSKCWRTANNFEPVSVAGMRKEGFVDRWIVYPELPATWLGSGWRGT